MISLTLIAFYTPTDAFFIIWHWLNKFNRLNFNIIIRKFKQSGLATKQIFKLELRYFHNDR